MRRCTLLFLLAGCMPAMPIPDARKPGFRRAVLTVMPKNSSSSDGCHRACSDKHFVSCTFATFDRSTVQGRGNDRIGGVVCFHAR